MTADELDAYKRRFGQAGTVSAGGPSHDALHARLRNEFGQYVNEADAHAHGWPWGSADARRHDELHRTHQAHEAWDWRPIGGS